MLWKFSKNKEIIKELEGCWKADIRKQMSDIRKTGKIKALNIVLF